jgi:hypothetical protein
MKRELADWLTLTRETAQTNVERYKSRRNLMYEPIIGLLHNLKEERFHPILFLNHPTPSGMNNRYKSKFHHNIGFATAQEAITNIKDVLVPKVEEHFGTPKLTIEKYIPWDGEDTPAMVVFFSDDDVPQPLF